jgi:hypothetical protein
MGQDPCAKPICATPPSMAASMNQADQDSDGVFSQGPVIEGRIGDSPHSPLQYARGLPPSSRISRLALAAPIVAILGSPCLVVPLMGWINMHIPQQFRQPGQGGWWQFWVHREAMIFATVLPVAAIIRICLSRRTRTGIFPSITALVISCLWWGLLMALMSTRTRWL